MRPRQDEQLFGIPPGRPRFVTLTLWTPASDLGWHADLKVYTEGHEHPYQIGCGAQTNTEMQGILGELQAVLQKTTWMQGTTVKDHVHRAYDRLIDQGHEPVQRRLF